MSFTKEDIALAVRLVYEGRTAEGVASILNIQPNTFSKRLAKYDLGLNVIRRSKREGLTVAQIVERAFPTPVEAVVEALPVSDSSLAADVAEIKAMLAEIHSLFVASGQLKAS